MVRCPSVDAAVSTGVVCDIKTFSDLADRPARFTCAACGEVHEWSATDAWLRDPIFATGRLADAHAMPPASASQHAGDYHCGLELLETRILKETAELRNDTTESAGKAKSLQRMLARLACLQMLSTARSRLFPKRVPRSWKDDQRTTVEPVGHCR
jgi:hypothetical protein